MKRGLRLLITGIEALIVLAVIYFEPTHAVRGILWCEAFFDGKPTSYWRDELNQWEVTKEPDFGWHGCRATVFRRNPTRIEAARERWLPARPNEISADDMEEPLAWPMEEDKVRRHGPPLLRGGDDAIPVLQALLDDPSPRIRLFAQIGLGMNPKIPGDE